MASARDDELRLLRASRDLSGAGRAATPAPVRFVRPSVGAPHAWGSSDAVAALPQARAPDLRHMPVLQRNDRQRARDGAVRLPDVLPAAGRESPVRPTARSEFRSRPRYIPAQGGVWRVRWRCCVLHGQGCGSWSGYRVWIEQGVRGQRARVFWVALLSCGFCGGYASGCLLAAREGLLAWGGVGLWDKRRRGVGVLLRLIAKCWQLVLGVDGENLRFSSRGEPE